jgi:pyruvate/2-oxoglutarate dehydrogenase complex dihydrolipoamide dehydrogenase (E3) component
VLKNSAPQPKAKVLKPTFSWLTATVAESTSSSTALIASSRSYRVLSIAAKQWVMITAGGGIGAELCRRFARCGSNIVLVDRNQSGLEMTSALPTGR